MKIFAVSDLHLPGNQEKPMDIFGGNWTGHFEKLRADWLDKVRAEDAVLLAGDFCWAMTLDDALSDLKRLAELPGKKILIRGNHDYWWSGITALRKSAPDDTFYFLQNDCMRLEDWIICGSRGWHVRAVRIMLRRMRRSTIVNVNGFAWRFGVSGKNVGKGTSFCA